MPNSSHNKTIAKNTLVLYIRMFLTMGISLYTSRVVLITLGVQDYGVYSIVGGIVTLFSFFNSAMTSATQRFLAIDLGKNDLVQLKKTFNATLNIHFVIAIIVLILSETIGLWFVNHKLNLPFDRMVAVNWVYQFSILTFLFGIIQVPYDALIVAREKMDIYAYMSILEVSLKLIIVYLLVVSTFDKLILYAALLFLISFIVRLGHKLYCKWYYAESKYQFYFDKSLYKELISFSGWSLFGSIASVARGQGSNILINLFFGTLLNAAYGISMQVQTTLQSFVLNFQMAVNPQIVKQFAVGNKEIFLKLIFQSAKFSYFLMFLIAFPIICNVDFILELWLKTPPKYTSVFVILCLINLLIECISGPLMIGAQATGNIKLYQIVIGTLIFLNLPIAYVLLKIYRNPELIYYSSIIISLLSLVFRLFFLKYIIKFPVLAFCNTILLRIIYVTILVILFNHYFFQLIIIRNKIVYFFINVSMICFYTIFSIYIIGINDEEKTTIKRMILNKIKK
jgi:O-antigen/teichoic acid export membrane protein